MNKVVLLTGGNLGEREVILHQANQDVEAKIGPLIQSSPLIESKAWGFESKESFLNQVLIVKTPLSAMDVLDQIQEIEINLGRVRKEEQWVSRLIDIDILFYNDDIIHNDRLIVPHKHIQDRFFTLYGLNLLMPKYVHPKLNKSIEKLMHECSDNSEVEVVYA